jgi:hypothetical protein
MSLADHPKGGMTMCGAWSSHRALFSRIGVPAHAVRCFQAFGNTRHQQRKLGNGSCSFPALK